MVSWKQKGVSNYGPWRVGKWSIDVRKVRRASEELILEIDPERWLRHLQAEGGQKGISDTGKSSGKGMGHLST